jgi:hypothetical protein
MRAVIFCFAVFVSLALSKPVFAQQVPTIDLRTTKVRLAVLQPGRTKFGKLVWKGGIKLLSKDARFGGFSGLALSKDGRRFAAVSDRAWWLTGKFVEKNDRLVGVSQARMSRLRLETRRPISSNWADSESLAPMSQKGIDGSLLVGFERRERILKYRFGRRGMLEKPRRIKTPRAVSSGPFNRELEAIGHFYSGRRKNWLLAVSEENLDKNGNIRSWLWKGKTVISFSVKRFEDYAVTDLAVAPDGKTFFTLERSFNLPKLPGFAVRRFSIEKLARGRTLSGKVLFSARQPLFAIDNMEGLAVHQGRGGQLYLTMISDNNYRPNLQSTLVFRFQVVD